MNAEITRRQIDLYDELQRRGVTVAPEVTGWGTTDPSRIPSAWGNERGYSEKDWTLAQYLSILGMPDASAYPEHALGYTDTLPANGPIGPWFDEAVQQLQQGKYQTRKVRPPADPPVVVDPYSQVGY